MPYTPSHVLHEDCRVGAKGKGHAIDRPHILYKRRQSKAQIHLFMESIQPGSHVFFGEHKGVGSVIESVVFFTERAGEREGEAAKKGTP